jgi:hypothetical protein
VYDTSEKEDRFIGIVSSKTKIAYEAAPRGTPVHCDRRERGLHGHASGCGQGLLRAGQSAHGVWKARFSRLPIHNQAGAKYSMHSCDFREWMAKTVWANVTPAAEAWYREHAADIHEKKLDYMRRWNTADAEQRAELTLPASDGI